MIQRRSSAIARIAVVAVAVVGLAACGTSPSPSPAASPSAAPSLAPVAVCTLAPGMDGFMGRAALAPASTYSAGGIDRCTWVYGADPTRYVGLSVGSRTKHADAIAAFGQGETVTGLGDEARWWGSNRTLSVAAGDRSFQVDLQLDEAEVTLDRAVAIASQVLDNLP